MVVITTTLICIKAHSRERDGHDEDNIEDTLGRRDFSLLVLVRIILLSFCPRRLQLLGVGQTVGDVLPGVTIEALAQATLVQEVT